MVQGNRNGVSSLAADCSVVKYHSVKSEQFLAIVSNCAVDCGIVSYLLATSGPDFLYTRLNDTH